MVKVYFEKENYANFNSGKLVAVFATEELYQLCLPHLEVQASLTDHLIVIEYIEEDLSDKF